METNNWENILTKDVEYVRMALPNNDEFLIVYDLENLDKIQEAFPTTALFTPDEMMRLKGKSPEHCSQVYAAKKTFIGAVIQ